MQKNKQKNQNQHIQNGKMYTMVKNPVNPIIHIILIQTIIAENYKDLAI